MFVIIHSTSCRMLASSGINSPLPKKGLGLFFNAAAAAASELVPISETELRVGVKQLSTEQLPRRASMLVVVLLSRAATMSDKEGIFMGSFGATSWQSLETFMSSSESSTLAASSPADTAAWSFRALHAFSSIDWRYFPCASIRSWRRRCTWFNHKKYFWNLKITMSIVNSSSKTETGEPRAMFCVNIAIGLT